VEADTVPPEVRDWLSMTFTRNAFSATRRRDNERVKFRSIVNVVRVGISLNRSVEILFNQFMLWEYQDFELKNCDLRQFVAVLILY